MVTCTVNNVLWQSVPQLSKRCMKSYLPGLVLDLLPSISGDAPTSCVRRSSEWLMCVRPFLAMCSSTDFPLHWSLASRSVLVYVLFHVQVLFQTFVLLSPPLELLPVLFVTFEMGRLELCMFLNRWARSGLYGGSVTALLMLDLAEPAAAREQKV